MHFQLVRDFPPASMLCCCLFGKMRGVGFVPPLCAGQNNKTVCNSPLTCCTLYLYPHIHVHVCVNAFDLWDIADTVDTNTIFLYRLDFGLPLISLLISRQQNTVLNQTIGCCMASCRVTSHVSVRTSSAQVRTGGQS